MRHSWWNGSSLGTVVHYLNLVAVFICVGRCNGGEPLASLTGRYPIERSSVPVLPVESLGEEIGLIVDTGSVTSALDLQFRRKLGMVVKKSAVSGVAGGAAVEFFHTPDIRFSDGQQFPAGNHVACMDLSPLKLAAGREAIGIAGMDFLKTQIVRFDFDEAYFQFCTEGSLQPSHAEKIYFTANTPRVLVRLPEEGFQSFLLDTGSFSNSIGLAPKSFNKLLQKRKIANVRQIAVHGAGGASTLRQGVIESLELGPHRFHNLNVVESQTNLLGMRFLRRFNVEFDFPNRVARFQAGKRINRRDPRSWAGFNAIPRGDTELIVETLDESGPAAIAGLKKGDRLLTINGNDAMQDFRNKILDLDQDEDFELRIRSERDGVQQELRIRLEDITDPFPADNPHEIIKAQEDFDAKDGKIGGQ